MISLDSSLAATMLAAVVTQADAGFDASYISIYSGLVPTAANTALAAQTLLAKLVCSDPTGTVSGKTLTFGTIAADQSADATGTATFFRLCNSNDEVVLQGSVTDSGGSGDLKLGTVALVQGGLVEITSATLTLP
jgi:hypothetical protein